MECAFDVIFRWREVVLDVGDSFSMSVHAAPSPTSKLRPRRQHNSSATTNTDVKCALQPSAHPFEFGSPTFGTSTIVSTMCGRFT